MTTVISQLGHITSALSLGGGSKAGCILESSEHLLKLKHTHISMNSNVLLSLQAKLQHSLFPTVNNVGINPKKMSEAIIK